MLSKHLISEQYNLVPLNWKNVYSLSNLEGMSYFQRQLKDIKAPVLFYYALYRKDTELLFHAFAYLLVSLLSIGKILNVYIIFYILICITSFCYLSITVRSCELLLLFYIPQVQLSNNYPQCIHCFYIKCSFWAF